VITPLFTRLIVWIRRHTAKTFSIAAALAVFAFYCLPSTIYWHNADVLYLAWNPDGTRVAATYSDGAISVITFSAQGYIEASRLLEPSITASSAKKYLNRFIEWSPDGKFIACCDSSVRVWSIETGHQLMSMDDMPMWMENTDPPWAWSKDSRRLAIAGGKLNERLLLWTIDSDQPSTPVKELARIEGGSQLAFLRTENFCMWIHKEFMTSIRCHS
jgi:WD40 repeat protein